MTFKERLGVSSFLVFGVFLLVSVRIGNTQVSLSLRPGNT